MSNEIRLSARGIGKRFAGTVALAEVDLDLRGGEMLALVGANGAGKSTFVKVICGAVLQDEGNISIEGKPVAFHRVADALAAGIAVAHQQVAIIPCLTGAENIMLGREPVRGGLIDSAAVRSTAKKLADSFGVAVQLNRECDALDPGETKILDILKAMANDPRVLILDEPTASLTLTESRRLFAFLDDLKRHGVSILFITHHLNEVFEHCDRVAVLKDGRKVHDGPVAALKLDELVHIMVGHAIEDTDWTSHASTDDVTVHVHDLHMDRLAVPELTVHRGEVVGLAGVLGAGQIDGSVQQWFVRHRLAAARAGVGGDDQLGLRVVDAHRQAVRGEAAEYHRVDRTDTRASQHRNRRLRNHRHVDQHAVALADAERQHDGRHAVDLGLQFPEGIDFFRIGFGGNRNQRGGVALRGAQALR